MVIVKYTEQAVQTQTLYIMKIRPLNLRVLRIHVVSSAHCHRRQLPNLLRCRQTVSVSAKPSPQNNVVVVVKIRTGKICTGVSDAIMLAMQRHFTPEMLN